MLSVPSQGGRSMASLKVKIFFLSFIIKMKLPVNRRARSIFGPFASFLWCLGRWPILNRCCNVIVSVSTARPTPYLLCRCAIFQYQGKTYSPTENPKHKHFLKHFWIIRMIMKKMEQKGFFFFFFSFKTKTFSQQFQDVGTRWTTRMKAQNYNKSCLKSPGNWIRYLTQYNHQMHIKTGHTSILEGLQPSSNGFKPHKPPVVIVL